jgi:hypothetical protein
VNVERARNASSRRSKTVRFGTWNLTGSGRAGSKAERQLHVIEASGADIVALQEATPYFVELARDRGTFDVCCHALSFPPAGYERGAETFACAVLARGGWEQHGEATTLPLRLPAQVDELPAWHRALIVPIHRPDTSSQLPPSTSCLVHQAGTSGVPGLRRACSSGRWRTGSLASAATRSSASTRTRRNGIASILNLPTFGSGGGRVIRTSISFSTPSGARTHYTTPCGTSTSVCIGRRLKR